MLYAYKCEMCDFVGIPLENENEAWGEGVQHFNNTTHEHGSVGHFDGAGQEQHRRHHNHHHGEPLIF